MLKRKIIMKIILKWFTAIIMIIMSPSWSEENRTYSITASHAGGPRSPLPPQPPPVPWANPLAKHNLHTYYSNEGIVRIFIERKRHTLWSAWVAYHRNVDDLYLRGCLHAFCAFETNLLLVISNKNAKRWLAAKHSGRLMSDIHWYCLIG